MPSPAKVNGQTVGVEFADKNAKLAVQYMQTIISDVRHTMPLRA